MARRAFHLIGGTGLTRYRYRQGVRILMYHKFPQPHHLEEQCRHLQEFYRPISMTELGQSLHEGKQIPKNAVVITVDDGYRDFWTNAFPVLSAYSIPAIVFLATDMLDQGKCLWVDWVRILFRNSPLTRVSLDLPLQESSQYSMESASEKDRASFLTKEALKQAPNGERLAFLERLPRLLQLTCPPPLPPDLAPLNWGEVRQMAAAGIDFGAHTMSHPILSRLASEEEIRAELAGSKARIEQELQRPVLHFCYPNGTFADFNAATIAVLKECGYRTSVVGEPGVNFPTADPYQLRRIGMEPGYTGMKFAQKAAGLPW